jgi:hypothetical protein
VSVIPLFLGVGIAILFPDLVLVSPEEGSFEEEQEGGIRSQNISRQGWRWKNNIEISEGSACFFAG